MKKIISYIILLVSFFSIPNFTNASSPWAISDTLGLDYAMQEIELNNINLKPVSFSNAQSARIYEKFSALNSTLKWVILTKIKNQEFDYYTSFWVVNTYSNFVYKMNKLFALYKQKENWSKDPFLDSDIITTYSQVKTHYKRLQYLVSK